MTAVNGPNGAGKSSLLHALVWALYGVTPDGVIRQAMRRQGSDGSPCRVIVEFEHDGQIVSVERGLKGRNDSAYMLVHINGVEQAKTPSTGTAYMLRLLGGLDSEGFMTAFVIRQKELDGLVKAKPAERRKLIERLAGIDRMSTAVKSAREEETEVKKRLELLPGDPDAVRAARAALEATQQVAGERWEAYEAATEMADARQAAQVAAQTLSDAMQDRVSIANLADRDVAAAERAHDLAGERAQATQRELDQTTTAAHGGTDADVAAAQAAYDTAAASLQTNKQAREGADRAVEAAHRDAAPRPPVQRACRPRPRHRRSCHPVRRPGCRPCRRLPG